MIKTPDTVKNILLKGKETKFFGVIFIKSNKTTILNHNQKLFLNNKKITLPKESESVLQVRVFLPKLRVFLAKLRVFFARERVFFARERVSFARERVSFAKLRVFFAKIRVFLTRERVFLARERLFVPRERVFVPRAFFLQLKKHFQSVFSYIVFIICFLLNNIITRKIYKVRFFIYNINGIHLNLEFENYHKILFPIVILKLQFKKMHHYWCQPNYFF
jgi:hypothetical protein